MDAIQTVLDQLANGTHLDATPNHDDDSLREIAYSLPESWQREKLLAHYAAVVAAIATPTTGE